MPEGHTVHAYAESIRELVGVDVAATSPQGRFSAAAVHGHLLSGVEAYGKHLLVDFSNAPSVHVHLGMRGKWLRFAPVTGPGLPQVRLRLATADVAWDLIAPSRCELLDSAQRAALLAGLGPDPLRPEADAAEACRRIGRARGPIGAVLLDQSVIAGVGNVFRAEALHACGIAPSTLASDLGEADLRRLWVVLQGMMTRAVREGRIITVDAEDRLALPEERARRVYKQASCYDCGGPVAVDTIGGRTSYACPRCQPG